MYVFDSGRRGWRGDECMRGWENERIWYMLYHSCGNRGVLEMSLCLGCGGVGGAGGEWVGGLD